MIIQQREGTERRGKSRRNWAHMKEDVATWPDHLGVTAVAQVEGASSLSEASRPAFCICF